MYDTINRPAPTIHFTKASFVTSDRCSLIHHGRRPIVLNLLDFGFFDATMLILVLIDMTLVLILIFYLGSNLCLYILGLCVSFFSLQLLSPLCLHFFESLKSSHPAVMYFTRSLLDFPLEHCSNPTFFYLSKPTDAS
jgi:hypothetical protein